MTMQVKFTTKWMYYWYGGVGGHGSYMISSVSSIDSGLAGTNYKMVVRDHGSIFNSSSSRGKKYDYLPVSLSGNGWGRLVHVNYTAEVTK